MRSSFRRLLFLLLLPLSGSLLLLYVLLLYFFTFLPLDGERRFFRRATRAWCRWFIYAAGIELDLVFDEGVRLPAQYILIANHPSFVEDFAIPACFDIYPLAKQGVRHWWFLGRISAYGGTVFVRRGDRDSRQAALNDMLAAVKSGKNLVLFPEGGCTGSDIHHTFRTGAFELAMKTQVPVLPVYLHYLDEPAFEWAEQSLPEKFIEVVFASDKRVRYIVHAPMNPADFTSREDFAEQARVQYVQWQQAVRAKKWT